MIAFPKLGSLGRIGNQLFQVATTIAIAREQNDLAALPSWDLESHLFLRSRRYAGEPGKLYREPKFSYVQIPRLIRSNSEYQLLEGYFQSERYFNRYRSLVSSALRLRGTKPGSKRKSLSIHVRRGDYVNLGEYHPTCSIHYYEKAVELVRKKASTEIADVQIFSDDPVWCLKNLGVLGTVALESSPLDHLRAMIDCRHQIIANSAFSWWAAWLAEQADSVIVAPERWFGPKGPQDDQDLVPSRWTRI